MSELPATGPPLLDLRWGQQVLDLDDGSRRREFRPTTTLQEADGYLHPGIAVAGVLGAARGTVGLPEPLGSVAVAFDAPVPLGMDLGAVCGVAEDGRRTVELEVGERPDVESEVLRRVLRGTVASGPEQEPPNAGAFRSAALTPIPEPREHDLYPRCWVCGQDNPDGLGLLPGWHGPDTVISAFSASDAMAEQGVLPPEMVATLLTCPTLWACRTQLEDLGMPAALLATVEIRFLEEAPASTSLRTVGIAGPPGSTGPGGVSGPGGSARPGGGAGAESLDGPGTAADPPAGTATGDPASGGQQALDAAAALIGEDGRIHAVANASWVAVAVPPAREPGRPAPASATSPLKGGRPEQHSEDEWGRPLPGRRDTAGARSERPDHDERDTMGVPVQREDPAEPRRTLGDERD